MKNFLLVLLLSILLFACSDKDKTPDVSNIEVEISVERFDKDLFTIDTNNLGASLKNLESKYPGFYNDYMQQILGVSGSDTNTATLELTKKFISGYYPIYEHLNKKYDNINWLKKDLEHAFQYVKYYFPDYKTGNTVLFIGPLDAPGVALTGSGIAIGLQQFAGKDFVAYQTTEAQQLFPVYISRRFEPEYVVANSMKAVVEDLYPDRSSTKGLIEQMIEKGKQWWLLDKFLPKIADSIKTGYTKQQLDFCESNEGLIWNEIITTQKDLYTKDPMTLQNYIGEAPYTQSMSPAAPGNIGQWVGWQIIKKFADRDPSLSVNDVLKTDAKKIFETAKYKPK